MSRADREQRRAADPGASVWVDASAGSGKTTVLVNRVLRLLLGAGAKPAVPERILCLTFTNAAAAEMANRLNDRLAEWAVASDSELTAALREFSDETPGPALRAAARRLLARVLDTPGGMRIQTVHAFCQSLLRRFPLEAGVPPHFEVIDERAAGELMIDVQNRLIASLDDAGPRLREAIGVVTRNAHEARIGELLDELASERGRLRQLAREAGGIDGLIARMHDAVGIEPGVTHEDITRAACVPGAGAEDALRRLATAMAYGGVRDRERGGRIAAWLAADRDERAAAFADYRRAFLKEDGEPLVRVATKAVIESAPSLEGTVAAEQARVAAVEEDRKRAVVAGATAALLTVGDALLDAYESRKHALGQLDFDDLILAARDLLTTPGRAEWVLYKLDGGLDHILIDEAQDTSPDQWEVVRALADEFHAGEGARDAPRTLFAVGDPKQSIYGFQRADPEKFTEMRRWFSGRARRAGQRWEDVPLDTSFRSTAPVLAAVDATFAAPDAASGLMFDNRPIRHRAHRATQAGSIELWPPTAPETADPARPWKPPVERIAPPSAAERLAAEVAREIRDLCDGGHRLESRDRAVRPGDIVVLVRSRNRFLDELVRRLKAEDVAVAGVDRLMLTGHIAAMDLIALGRFLLFPSDDLSLAEALKSPLFGFDDDALFALAHGREVSLWRRLRDEAECSPLCAEAAERLRELLRRADRVTPWELYADLLSAGGGRRRFAARLGDEATEVLDEFLAQAMAFERAAPPGLQGFLHWLATGDVEVKREQETGGDAVRIMTVHGAKGMEAPIVFLPDTMHPPRTISQLVWSPDGDMALWPVRKPDWDPLSREWRAAAKERDREEYRRLLYVAMTRAEDRLVVCGWRNQRQKTDNADAWRAMVARGLAACPDAREEKNGIVALRSPRTAPPDRTERARPDAADDAPTPPWLRAPRPPETVAETVFPSVPEPARQPEAEERGRRLHALLQAWPALPESVSDADRTVVEVAVEIVRRDPVFAPIFGPDSLAEVAVATAGAHAMSGRIDRIAVTDEATLAIDFKTGGAPEDTIRPPRDHLRQMAAYRDALRRIYPDRPIRCALLWIDHGVLAPLDSDSLDRFAA